MASQKFESFCCFPFIACLENLTVAFFISQDTHEWNKHLIEKLLNAEDAQHILKIPLLHTSDDDNLVWSCSKDGSYTVKSAHHSIMKDILETDHLKATGNWLDIWKLQVLPKIKHFLWRVLRCCLPTRERLSQKGIQWPSVCVYCLNNIENSWHIFLNCPRARQVWEKAGLWHIIQSSAEFAI